MMLLLTDILQDIIYRVFSLVKNSGAFPHASKISGLFDIFFTFPDNLSDFCPYLALYESIMVQFYDILKDGTLTYLIS